MFRYSKTKAIDFLDTYEMLLKNKEKIYIPLFKIIVVNNTLIAVIFVHFLIGGR